MIFYSTADPDFNAAPPAGYYDDSGWHWQGEYSHGTGTVVSPDQVLTAKHLPSDMEFKLHGKIYPVLDIQDDPESDLRLLTVNVSDHGPFSSWAPIYSGNSESGREIVVYGRGVGRGEEVVVGSQVRGWRYSHIPPGPLRWGTNEIAGFAPYRNHADYLLKADFDPVNNPNECHLTDWDSGGGVFVRENQTWQLAGVNHAVDSRFGSVTGDAGGFKAALFDTRGLIGDRGGAAEPGLVASCFYATRVSRRTQWLLPRLHVGAKKAGSKVNPNVRNALIVFALAGGYVVWGRKPRKSVF